MRNVALATAAVALVAVAAAEALLRFQDARRDPVLRSRDHLYYRHKKQDRALVRGADHYGSIHVNHYGFRGPEISLHKAPGTTRIMVVGLSTTFDPCARADSLMWTARLEHWLDSLAPGRRFEVINAGTSGVELIDNLIRLQTELYAFGVDVFIVYASHGVVNQEVVARPAPDDSGARWTPTPDAAPAVSPLGEWLEQRSAVYRRVAGRLRAEDEPPDLSPAEWEAGIQRATAVFQRNLVSFVLVAKSYGARVVLVELAHAAGARGAAQLTPEEREVWQRRFGVRPEITLNAYHRFSTVWQAVSDSLDVPFVPTAGFGIQGTENFCPRDPIHVNAQGADLLGHRLAETLLARNALPPAP